MDPIRTKAGYPLHFAEDWSQLAAFLGKEEWSGILVIVDAHTKKDCLPLLQTVLFGKPHKVISIPAGEATKGLDTCRHVWERMLDARADRHSLVINLGGGVVGDLGGFCAATFKRGLPFIQIPTSLLAMVDASIGGKLGVDLNSHKNMVGCFSDPEAVFIFPAFLDTLPDREFRSGTAEIIKHALIASSELWEEVRAGIPRSGQVLFRIIRKAAAIKVSIVDQDPLEKGIRKALNFGHTIGHALESFSLRSSHPLLHGEAVAAGMICEAWLSAEQGLLANNEFHQVVQLLSGQFPFFRFRPEDQEALMTFIRQDKKNRGDTFRFSLLDGFGSCRIDQAVSEKALQGSLEFYSDLCLKGNKAT